ncbi:MAG: glycosyltransferase family 4 protein [bacterium]
MYAAKMKVALVHRTMSHYRAGPLLALQRTLGGGLTVVTSRELVPDGKFPFFVLPAEIPHKQLPAKLIRVRLGGRTYNFVWQSGLVKELERLDPDVVLCEGESNLISNLVIAAWSRRRRVPYVWWSLGRTRSRPLSGARRLTYFPLRAILWRAAAIVCYSSYGRTFYHSYYGIPEERLFVALNCVDAHGARNVSHEDRQSLRRQLGLHEEDVVLLYVGALRPEKRPDLFLNLSTRIQRRMRNVASVVIGDGPLRAELERQARGQRILFLGRIVADVDRYFQAADIFVMPGLGGLALHQAMANGLPIVSAPADGTELDLVEPLRNGCILESGDPEMWIEQMWPLLLDRGLRMRMGRRSREMVDERANVETMTQQIIRALEYALVAQ